MKRHLRVRDLWVHRLPYLDQLSLRGPLELFEVLYETDHLGRAPAITPPATERRVSGRLFFSLRSAGLLLVFLCLLSFVAVVVVVVVVVVATVVDLVVVVVVPLARFLVVCGWAHFSASSKSLHIKSDAFCNLHAYLERAVICVFDSVVEVLVLGYYHRRVRIVESRAAQD